MSKKAANRAATAPPQKSKKTEAKSGAKYGHIKTDTDDNGDTVVHITIKSTGKDKKKQAEQ